MGWEGASMYIPRGKGVAKAWYGQFVSLENQFTADRVWLRGRVMPTRGGGRGEVADVALNSLLMASLSLKLSLSCKI